MIVAPGGGFLVLSMENEGWRVAKALADCGVAAFVLKYRLKPTPAGMGGSEQAVTAMFADAGRPQSRLSPDAAIAGLSDQIADARAAVALVRVRSVAWHVDPERIGMMGFSAGAMTTMATTMAAPETRLAFIAPIYGAMEAAKVPSAAPPLFAVLSADDPLFANKGFGLIESWQQAKRPVEFHLYQGGGHGFGLGKTGTTSTGWFEDFMRWLNIGGFMARR